MLVQVQLVDGITDYQYKCCITKKADHTVKVCRVYGSQSEVRLPAQIDGCEVSEIGAYCFATKANLPIECEEDVAQVNPRIERELCGDYITLVSLPDTVETIDNCAFYNCTQLTELTIGAALCEINSDAFMNCSRLHRIRVRAGAGDVTGVRAILNQITSEIETIYENDQQIEARILYPEYTESYEEIGPAHIFGLNVDGEGYRARQQFRDGVVDLAGYDGIFEKAKREETRKTLLYLALNRLQYPYELSKRHQLEYEAYVSDNASRMLQLLIQNRSLEELQFLCTCSKELIRSQQLEEAVEAAVQCGWTKGSAALLRWKQSRMPKNRYTF